MVLSLIKAWESVSVVLSVRVSQVRWQTLEQEL